MDATPQTISAPTREEYTSRPGALIWFFRKSRDQWKSKYQALKPIVKTEKNRVADLTKSREQWRLKAEQTGKQLSALEAEIAELRTRMATLKDPKKVTREVAR